MEALGQAVFQEAKFEAVEACWCAVGSEAIQSFPRSTLKGRGQESEGQCMDCASSILLSANPLFSCSGLEQST